MSRNKRVIKCQTWYRCFQIHSSNYVNIIGSCVYLPKDLIKTHNDRILKRTIYICIISSYYTLKLTLIIGKLYSYHSNKKFVMKVYLIFNWLVLKNYLLQNDGIDSK